MLKILLDNKEINTNGSLEVNGKKIFYIDSLDTNSKINIQIDNKTTLNSTLVDNDVVFEFTDKDGNVFQLVLKNLQDVLNQNDGNEIVNVLNTDTNETVASVTDLGSALAAAAAGGPDNQNNNNNPNEQDTLTPNNNFTVQDLVQQNLENRNLDRLENNDVLIGTQSDNQPLEEQPTLLALETPVQPEPETPVQPEPETPVQPEPEPETPVEPEPEPETPIEPEPEPETPIEPEPETPVEPEPEPETPVEPEPEPEPTPDPDPVIPVDNLPSVNSFINENAIVLDEDDLTSLDRATLSTIDYNTNTADNVTTFTYEVTNETIVSLYKSLGIESFIKNIYYIQYQKHF